MTVQQRRPEHFRLWTRWGSQASQASLKRAIEAGMKPGKYPHLRSMQPVTAFAQFGSKRLLRFFGSALDHVIGCVAQNLKNPLANLRVAPVRAMLADDRGDLLRIDRLDVLPVITVIAMHRQEFHTPDIRIFI